MVLIDIAVIVAVLVVGWLVIVACRDRIATVMVPIGAVIVTVGLFTTTVVWIVGAAIIVALPMGLASDPRLGPDKSDSIW